MPIDDTTTKKFTVNSDGTWSVAGQADGHVFVRPRTGSLDFRSDVTKTGFVCDRSNWIEMNCSQDGTALLATRLHNHRATNGDITGGQ